MIKKIGLAISGAGTLGPLEVGATECLYDNNFRPSQLVGTSAGSITGAMLSLGYNPRQLVDIVCSADFEKLIPYNYFNIFKGYLASNKNVIAWLKDITGNAYMSDCKIPLITISSDVITGSPYVFNSTVETDKNVPLWEAILASMSIPDVFPLFKDHLVDGGLLDNLGINYLPDNQPNVALKVVDGSKNYTDVSVIKRQLRYVNMAISANEQVMTDLANYRQIPIIRLNSGRFTFMDRSMSVEDKKALIYKGYEAVENRMRDIC